MSSGCVGDEVEVGICGAADVVEEHGVVFVVDGDVVMADADDGDGPAPGGDGELVVAACPGAACGGGEPGADVGEVERAS